jgi:small subunit ribosomal protein YMR-31
VCSCCPHRHHRHLRKIASKMWATHRLLDAHVHRPLIRFLGKRLPSSRRTCSSLSARPLIFLFHLEPQPPHSHPLAPPDIASRFSSKGHTSPHPSRGPTQFKEFWEAPARFWGPSRKVEDVEIEAVLVSNPFPHILSPWLKLSNSVRQSGGASLT